MIRGSLGELAARAAAGEIDPRGEATIVVGWWEVAGRSRPVKGAVRAASLVTSAGRRYSTPPDALARARVRVEALVAGGTARGEAARLVAAETGLPRRGLYGADTSR